MYNNDMQNDVERIATRVAKELVTAYDYEMKKMEAKDTPDDWDPLEDEDTLSYAVETCLGAEYSLVQGASGKLEYRHAVLSLGLGGPGIWFHTAGWVEVAWGTASAEAFVPSYVCNAANDRLAASISGLEVD